MKMNLAFFDQKPELKPLGKNAIFSTLKNFLFYSPKGFFFPVESHLVFFLSIVSKENNWHFITKSMS